MLATIHRRGNNGSRRGGGGGKPPTRFNQLSRSPCGAAQCPTIDDPSGTSANQKYAKSILDKGVRVKTGAGLMRDEGKGGVALKK